MITKSPQKEQRRQDPYLDRRSGDDRREVYLIEYFSKGKPERRGTLERRDKGERREGCVRVSDWSSICVNGVKKRS